MSKKYDLRWFGMLTIENVQQVADLLLQLLNGKRYTFVAANEFCAFKPEVRTGQHLNERDAASGKAITVYYDEKVKPPKFAGFIVADSYGVWGCSTSLVVDEHDSKFNNPYISFEYDRVTIIHRAPAGHLLYWVAAIEKS